MSWRRLSSFARNKARTVDNLGRKIALKAIATLVAVCSCSPGQSQELNQFLREWVLRNIVFTSAQDGQRAVLSRRLPVKADLRMDAPSVAAEAKLAVSSFSGAFGLQLEFTPDRPNLIIVIGSEINDGDKLRRAFLNGLGLPDAAINMIAATNNWSGGCGYYNFIGRSGDISGTVIAGDRRLPPERLRDCIVSGVAFSFGARARPSATFDTSNGYIQYLLLSRSMTACEGQVRESPNNGFEEEYISCVVTQLRSKITVP